MEDFLKMDIFFVVTTAVVFVVGLFFLVVLFYAIRILRNVDHISENISEESDSLRTDIAVLRTKLRDEGLKLKHFSDFFSRFVTRNTEKHGRRKKDAGEE